MSSINVKFTEKVIFPSGESTQITQTRTLDRYTQLSQNFKLYELANNNASESVKAIWNSDVDKHCQMLQEFRNLTGTCNVSSWYRTASYNRKCGGSINSLHLKALATDLKYPKLSDAKYSSLLNIWQSICTKYEVVGGINRYTNGVHLSSREDLFGYTDFVTRDYRGKKGDW